METSRGAPGVGSLAERFARARDRRAELVSSADTTAYRMVNGEADGVEGATLDWFDGVAVLSLYRAFDEAEERALVDAAATLGPRAVYLKRRPKEGRAVSGMKKEALAPEQPAHGEPSPEHEVKESGVRFHIRPAQGLAVGLYLDMRQTRAWVKANAQGATVLNCFAYTCAFGVMARVGGAKTALNVDLSRRSLDWGEQNARLNGLATDQRDHLSGDVFEWLPRLKKKGQRFDLVVLDPPSFATTKKAVFVAGRDYGDLVSRAAPLVQPGGRLVACCNLEKLPEERFARMVEDGLSAAGRTGKVAIRFGPSPADYPAAAGKAPGTWLKVLVLHVR